jgi:hypothetical protein
MPSQPITPRWSFARSLAFASGLHALLIVLLLLAPAARKLAPEQIDSVSVEVVVQTAQPPVASGPTAVEAQPQDTLIYPAVPAISVLPQRSIAPPSPPDRGSANTEMVTVTRFYSSAVLAEPRNAQVRQALGQLAGDEKAVQICNLEAMEQAARQQTSLHPDFVVAYATADILMEEDLVIAEGAALRSRPNWHALRYRCMVRPDRTGIIAFSFAVDSAIPRTRWQEISLPSGGD